MILYSKYTLGQGEERERQVLKVVVFFFLFVSHDGNHFKFGNKNLDLTPSYITHQASK